MPAPMDTGLYSQWGRMLAAWQKVDPGARADVPRGLWPDTLPVIRLSDGRRVSRMPRAGEGVSDPVRVTVDRYGSVSFPWKAAAVIVVLLAFLWR